MALILVIDDDDAMRRLIVRTLSADKHKLIEAPNGEDGVKMVGELKPDAVITDILMPQQEGIQTIREIREMAPEIKIIAMDSQGETLHTWNIVGAVITPTPDPFNQTLVAVPMYLLFELGLFVARFA